VGIGPVPDRWDPADFVLGKFAKDERETADLQVARAADAVKAWAASGIQQAMNQFNGKA
jgi:PTH1 family peptidyl-tRNA hydrolase